MTAMTRETFDEYKLDPSIAILYAQNDFTIPEILAMQADSDALKPVGRNAYRLHKGDLSGLSDQELALTLATLKKWLEVANAEHTARKKQ